MKAAAQGFTLVELAVVIALIAILSAFGTLAWTASGESRDATMVQAAQANLQAVISQGSARLDTNPLALPAASVQNAVRELIADGAAGTGKSNLDFTMTAMPTGTLSIEGGTRTATYTVLQNGDVQLTGLGGTWTQYGVQNGVIRKN